MQKEYYPEIYRGQIYNISGEIFELVDFRVTNVLNQYDFITTAFFKSLEENSAASIFEEKISNIISNNSYVPYYVIYKVVRNDISGKELTINTSSDLEENENIFLQIEKENANTKKAFSVILVRDILTDNRKLFNSSILKKQKL